ncbi:hypothetical protein [Dongshaea marina]|uniref:hypothetical protein n=1 Tax=Dongshaea marina TaxID=2047966 RepID=UPI00131F1FFD|nr:hypothetical protein [Dongshaea marina]
MTEQIFLLLKKSKSIIAIERDNAWERKRVNRLIGEGYRIVSRLSAENDQQAIAKYHGQKCHNLPILIVVAVLLIFTLIASFRFINSGSDGFLPDFGYRFIIQLRQGTSLNTGFDEFWHPKDQRHPPKSDFGRY